MTDPELNSRYWLVRKVICLVGYYGGFRNVELKSLTFENVESDEAGYFFKFARSKQRSKLETSGICVPRRQHDWIPCSEDSGRRSIDYDPASVIDAYFEAVMQDLGVTSRDELKGGLFKGTHGKAGKRFVNANIGKNMLAGVGVEVATELCLRYPETFTGHCWRRSAGTNASDAGVNVTTLMSMMGWKCPKTAMRYVDASRRTAMEMSLYLTNVQRANKRDPFPSKQRPSRKTHFSERGGKKLSLTSNREGSENGLPSKCLPENSVFAEKDSENVEIDEFESSISTQCLLADPVVESVVADGAGVDAVASVDDLNLGVKREGEKGSFSRSVTALTQASSSTTVTTPVSSVATGLVNLAGVDPRLMQILQNVHNHGSLQIHFNFGDAGK